MLGALALSLGAVRPAAHAGCTSERSEPKWVSKTPRGYQYHYAVGEAQADAKGDALSGAIANGVGDLLRKGKVRIASSTEIRETTDIDRKSGSDGESYVERAKVKVTDDLRIQVGEERVEGLEVVETFEEDCGSVQVVRALVRAKRIPPLPGSPPNPALSAWVPSLAQFQKEETTKGVIILVGETALIGSAVTFFLLASDDLSQAAAATRQADRDFYNDRSVLRNTIGLGAAVGAGALYVYNLLDGMLGPDTINYAALEAAPGIGLAAAPLADGAVLGLGGSF